MVKKKRTEVRCKWGETGEWSEIKEEKCESAEEEGEGTDVRWTESGWGQTGE